MDKIKTTLPAKNEQSLTVDSISANPLVRHFVFLSLIVLGGIGVGLIGNFFGASINLTYGTSVVLLRLSLFFI